MSNYGGNIMRVGFYECDVTPPLGCGIPGYSNFHSGQDVVDRLYVKAIVVESQETISAIVAIDACVMDNDIYDAVVIDICWFCQNQRFIFEGTEDMVAEYHDYCFQLIEKLKFHSTIQSELSIPQLYKQQVQLLHLLGFL